MSEDIEKRVREIVVEKLKVGPERVTREADFVDDLGADSLDIVDVILTLEKRLGRHIPEKEANGMKTFGDLVDYLSSTDA